MPASLRTSLLLVAAIVLFSTTHFERTEAFSQQKRIVSVNSGLDDARAIVGKIFRYKIPEDAFDGNVDSYEVTEAGGTNLQDWLVWNPQTSELVGVPGEQDSGPNYVQVTAVAISERDKQRGGGGDEFNYTINESAATLRATDRAKDIFSINVMDEYRLQQQSTSTNPSFVLPFDQRMTCDDARPATTMTLTFGQSVDALTTLEKISLIQKVANTFVKDEGAVRLFSNGDDGFSTLKRSIQMASSIGNETATTQSTKTNEEDEQSEQQQQSASETVLTWKLNCDSESPTKGTEGTIEWLTAAESEHGYLRKTWGYPLASWYVASITYEPKRRRRQASYVTPHSHIGPTGPTYAADVVSTSSVPTRSPQPARTPTIRIRPTGFVPTAGLDAATSTKQTTTATTPLDTTTSPTTSAARTRPAGRTTTPGAIVTTKKPGDSRPTVKNSLGTLSCRRNYVCDLEIPSDTFHDAEDGDTGKLKLRLDAMGDVKKHWLVLDEQRQYLTGLPTQSGTSLFRLTATDSGNRQASDAFSVDVADDPIKDEALNHRIFIEFTVPDEKSFAGDVKSKIRLINKLAQYFNDRSSANIRINSLTDNGFVLSWTNSSLLGDRCPKSELRAIMDRLVLGDGKVKRQFKSYMEPAFVVSKGYIEYAGSCAGFTTAGVVKGAVPPGPTSASEVTDGPHPSATTTGVPTSVAAYDSLYSTILPIVIIAVLLLVASLVACILWRKNRRNKKKTRAESKSEFVSKGAPVIFPDEVDLDKESTAATPMLLKDEKPPLQPLDFSTPTSGHHHGHSAAASERPHHYHHGNGNGAPVVRSPLVAASKSPTGALSGPGRALGKTHVSEAETELWQKPLLQDVDEHPMYRPPPAFEPAGGMKENRSPRPKHASPQQRDPPPYVPP